MTTKTVKLREILEVQNGFAFKTEFFNEADGLPLIRIRDLGTDSTKTHYSGEYRDEFIVAPGDYLIGMDGNFRCRRWAGPKALLNQRVCRLRNFVPEVLPEYLFFGIQPKLDAIEASTAFATVKHISAKQILDIEFPLPPLSEQRRIVDLLSRAEGIVRLRRDAEKKAAELIPALFLDMFGDPATNPKGWRKTPLSNLCAAVDDIKCGPFGTQLAKSEFRLEGIPLWGIKHVNVGFTKPTVEFLSPEKAAELDTYSIKPGDIVMTRKGTIGNCALYPENMPSGIMHSDLLRIRASLDKCFPEFLADQLHISRDVENQIARTASSGAVMPGINVGRLKAILVLAPPLKEQVEYVTKIQQIRSIQSLQSAATIKAKSTFDALLARVFSES